LEGPKIFIFCTSLSFSNASTPSPDDVTVTRQIIRADKLLDIDTLDHSVIGHDRFVSLKDRGLDF
jgi:DNA repair protein RadC